MDGCISIFAWNTARICNFQIYNRKKKEHRHAIHIGVLWWRRRRDLNPRCTFAHYSLSRGAPSATWVLLHGTGQPMKFCLPGRETGGERGIRTPGTFRYHWFSRPAPSTARPSLLIATSEGYYSMLPALRQSFFPNTFPTWNKKIIVMKAIGAEAPRGEHRAGLSYSSFCWIWAPMWAGSMASTSR